MGFSLTVSSRGIVASEAEGFWFARPPALCIVLVGGVLEARVSEAPRHVQAAPR